MIPRAIALGALVLGVGCGVASAQEPAPRLERHPVTVARATATNPAAALDTFIDALESFDRARAEAIEEHYREAGNREKRLLEKRFGLVEHRFRVSADPRDIYAYWDTGRHAARVRAEVLREITEGWYSAYYFFDGVIRPNVFARAWRLRSDETAVHEKIHLLQPRLYATLDLTCRWRRLDDPCAASMEPVAAYLTEWAVRKRVTPWRDDKSVNRRVGLHFERESRRCQENRSLPRCPEARRVHQYLVLPIEIAKLVDRYGLEGGLRRFVEAIGEGEVAVRTGSSAGI